MPGNRITLFDDTGDSMSDNTNDALRVNVVAGGAGGGVTTDIEDGTGDSVMDAANNAIRVNIVAGAGSGGTAQADESAFTEGTTSFTPIGGVLNETIVSDPTEDQAAAVRITAKRAIHVNLRDAAGAEVAVGGGTQYTEDAAAAANPVGTALNLIRKDTPASEVDLDGDNVAARGTSKGELYVKHIDAIPVTDNAGSLTIDAASLPLPTGAATAAAQLPDGHNVTVDNAAGASAVNIQDGGNSITVDGSVSVTGAVDTELTTADLDTGAGTDTRAVVGLVGSASGGGALIPGSATDGLLVNLGANNDVTVAGVATAANQLPDGHNVTVDNAAGASAVNIQDGGNSITVDGSLTVDLGANNDVTVTSGTIDVIGTVADDSATPGDPVMVGGEAVSPDGTDPTAVAEADVVRFRTDLNRRLYVATNHPRTWHYHLNTSSAQTDTSVQAAPGAGLRLVITNIQFTSGAATAINMFLEEGVTTIWGPIYLEAVAGRGYVSGPIFKPVTANTALTLTTSAAIAHAVEILGFIEAV